MDSIVLKGYGIFSCRSEVFVSIKPLGNRHSYRSPQIPPFLIYHTIAGIAQFTL